MKIISYLSQKYKGIDYGDLSGNQKKEIYKALKELPVDSLCTLEEHKEYIELLRKFRQASMEDMKFLGKKFIETLESLLSVGEDGMYSNSQRFIYELIQNVDDCEYNDIANCNLEIQFNYSTNPSKVIFIYNEKGFSPSDVFNITGIAETSKNISPDKLEIGEKGIGFKSVFGIADKVLIESGMFSFELYKHNFTVPIPRYESFTQINGTKMTLEMSPERCKSTYDSLVRQYLNKDAVLNKNPILFLNKLTHLKMYVDDVNHIVFNTQRKEPIKKGCLTFEENVAVSADISYSSNGIERTQQREVLCYRYTMPVTYGINECIFRYGKDSRFTEKKHHIIGVLGCKKHRCTYRAVYANARYMQRYY